MCLHSCLYASIACPISWVYLILKSVFFFFFLMWGIYFVCCMIWLWHMELLWCTHEVHQKIISISMLPFCIDAMCASSTSIVNTVVRIILVLGIVTGIKYFVLSLPSCCGSISPCLLITWICK